MARMSADEKRRVILDAAVRVFAERGFNTARVSDIADEAGVAYGLVYHYFGSKDEVLDTLFLDRWNLLLEAIREIDDREVAPREKLLAITSFIVDSYQIGRASCRERRGLTADVVQVNTEQKREN